MAKENIEHFDDPEIEAMAVMLRAVDGLDATSQDRAICYVRDKLKAGRSEPREAGSARVKTLEQALLTYGGHTDSCKGIDSDGLACHCGFTDVSAPID